MSLRFYGYRISSVSAGGEEGQEGENGYVSARHVPLALHFQPARSGLGRTSEPHNLNPKP